MTPGIACIIFELDGRRYEYDDGLPYDFPDDVQNRLDPLYDNDGFLLGAYPETLTAELKDEGDDLPYALWEIARIGGKVIEIQGARPNGAIHWEDWKNPRIY